MKIGGEALDDPKHASLVAEDIALMTLVGIQVVVVHGGGPQVSRGDERRGIEPTFVGGLRVTDEDAMEIVRAGARGHDQSGLSSARLRRRPAGRGRASRDRRRPDRRRRIRAGPDGEDLGRVGRGKDVDPLCSDRCSTMATRRSSHRSLSARTVGRLNVNADAVAGAIAVALGATKLVYLTNVEGLYRTSATPDRSYQR